jgi:PAS domain S-box-containing protein
VSPTNPVLVKQNWERNKIRIKRQFILSIAIFTILILTVFVSIVFLNQKILNLNEQATSTQNIQNEASHLSYLSDSFFLYQNETKLVEWKTTLTSINNEMLELNSTNPQQQALVNNIKTDLSNIAVSYSDVVHFLWSAPRGVSIRVMPEFQTAWNQTSEQYQALNLDTSLLITFIDDQANQLRLTITALIVVVFGLFASFLFTNYLITYRRTLKSILNLKAVTAIVGSGNLEYQIKIKQKDEIGELADAFNQMTSNLKTVTASKVELAKEIDERKKIEGQLRESEQRWVTTLTSIGDGVIATNFAGEITFLNAEAEKLTGWKLSEAMHKPLKNVFRIINEITHVEAENPVSTVLETGHVAGLADQTILVRKNGTEVAIDDSAAPIRSEDNKMIGVVLVFRDVTERRKAEEELNRTMEQLVLVNEKLGVVGSLTRHDVRNKLSTVTGYAYLLKKKHSDQADIVDGLGKMEQAVKDSVKIFEFAKMYEQLGAEQLTYISVEEKITEATAIFSGELPKIINQCHGLTVLADSFLRQLFYNFIDNTRKYGEKTTTIRIHCEKAGQDSLKLVYEDDGIGISAENKLNLFREGFSTGGSTGFGLFLTKKMIDVYGWAIEENGEPGIGAKFSITIPKLNKSGKENYQIK